MKHKATTSSRQKICTCSCKRVLAVSRFSANNEAVSENGSERADSTEFTPIGLRTRKGKIIPRSYNQQQYVKNLTPDVSFGVGPAGTGKTYLAVACAVDMLERNEIERILLVRPAVEAGEKLGFYRGIWPKNWPYLRPLYDALYEMLGFEKVAKLIEKQVIEVAPPRLHARSYFK